MRSVSSYMVSSKALCMGLCKAPWPFVELRFPGLPLVSKPHLLTAVLQGKQGHHNGLWGGQSSRLSLSPLHLQPHEDRKLNFDK